jgi:hypothetical protein
MTSENMAKPSLNARQERFRLQAYFLSPIFDLFKDFPALSQHLFHGLGSHYNLRLTDIRFETGAGSLGDAVLRFSWPNLAEIRLYLDRVEVESSFLPFLRFQGRDLVGDVLRFVSEYLSNARFRTYSVTQEIHGELAGQPRHEFLARFTPSFPEGFGPALGAGIVFYFGEEADRLFGSVTLDFSRDVEGGIFVQSVVLYDASKVSGGELMTLSRSEFDALFDRIGLMR